MKVLRSIIYSLCLATIFVCDLEAKEWRGLVPLSSTREDVTRVLGKSPDANHIRAKYSLVTEDVYIVFASRENHVDDCVKQLPLDTVLQIQITPKIELDLADLRLDERRLKKFDPSDPQGIGYEAYVDEEEGIIARTYNNKVDEIVYIAAGKDQHLCSTYYQNPKVFVQMIVDFFCPTILVTEPEDKPEEGSRVTFSVSIAGDPNMKPTFNWTLSAGIIIDGRDTHTITVDTKGLGGQSIKATIEIGGMDESCPNKASGEVQVARRRGNAHRVRGIP